MPSIEKYMNLQHALFLENYCFRILHFFMTEEKFSSLDVLKNHFQADYLNTSICFWVDLLNTFFISIFKAVYYLLLLKSLTLFFSATHFCLCCRWCKYCFECFLQNASSRMYYKNSYPTIIFYCLTYSPLN